MSTSPGSKSELDKPNRSMPDLGADVPALHEVTSLDDIRVAIDAIDGQVIALLGARLDYVKAAAGYKPNLQAVPAPERVRDMLDARARWAEDAGLSADFIAPLFAQISEWFIRQQIAHWPNRIPADPPVEDT